MQISKTQVDFLGDRLKKGAHTESDLRLLDEYRQSFGAAYEAVVRTIREYGESPTGRLAKSTHSIVEKLRRESIRLSQVQDIAGCRVVVNNVLAQDPVLASLRIAFPGASVIDRRANPSHGYRAVHIISVISGKPVEIQVRSRLQHLWAELSEKASDVLDQRIKYGGGPAEWQTNLKNGSIVVAAYESLETGISVALDKLRSTITEAAERYLDEQGKEQGMEELRKFEEAEKLKVELKWKETAEFLNTMISALDDGKRQKQ